MQVYKGTVYRDKQGYLQTRIPNGFVWKDKAYGIGTKFKIKNNNKIQVATFIGDRIILDDGYPTYMSTVQSPHIIEILEPVYIILEDELPKSPKQKATIKDIIAHKPHPNNIDEVFYGWWWYIAIMLIGTIFNDRWTIWIITTIIFFSWRYNK
jgi:hypothetical protein